MSIIIIYIQLKKFDEAGSYVEKLEKLNLTDEQKQTLLLLKKAIELKVKIEIR